MPNNFVHFLCSVRHYYSRRGQGCPNTMGAGGNGTPLVLADYKQYDGVRCASPIFMLIAYYLGFTVV